MDAAKDRLLRRVTIGVTSVVTLLMITSDYGSDPHALSIVTRWWDAGKEWVLKPSDKELSELESLRKDHYARKGTDEDNRSRKMKALTRGVSPLLLGGRNLQSSAHLLSAVMSRRFFIGRASSFPRSGLFASSEVGGKNFCASTSYSEEGRQESSKEQSTQSQKPEGGSKDKGRHDPSPNTAAGARTFFADKFQKGFTFASASATAGFSKLRNTNVVDAFKGSYNFLKEELNTPASRRKAKSRAATTAPVETSSETAIVPVIKERSAWQKKLDELLDKARRHPVFKRLTSVKEHPVVAKSQELAEDLRERWETSDSPVVHKIQDINDSLFGETATAVAMKEVRQRDPSFSIPDFIIELQEDIRPILLAYLKGDYKVLRQKCSREVVDRCRAERTALESQGIFLDHKILHVSDIEVKETKLMGNSPIIIVAFQTQQIYCARDKLGNITQGAQDEIHTVYYAWAMQQMSLEDMEEGETHPRWQLREMQQLGIQAII